MNNNFFIIIIKYLHQYIMQTQTNELNNTNLTVDHINRDKMDNRIENLRWVSLSEKNDYPSSLGLLKVNKI
jgi:hypothetical protein